MTLVKKNHASLLEGKRDGNSLASFLFYNRKQVSFPVEYKSTYDEKLKANYALYQQLLGAISKGDFKVLEYTIEKLIDSMISNYMKTSIKTLKKHLPYIKNSFTYPFNNGRIEGINNKIKVLNRVAYGYRNFTNFKNRILLHFKLKPIIQKPQTNQKETHYKVA